MSWTSTQAVDLATIPHAYCTLSLKLNSSTTQRCMSDANLAGLRQLSQSVRDVNQRASHRVVATPTHAQTTRPRAPHCIFGSVQPVALPTFAMGVSPSSA